MACKNFSEAILGYSFAMIFIAKLYRRYVFGYDFRTLKHTPDTFVRGGICLPVTPVSTWTGATQSSVLRFTVVIGTV